MLITSKTLSSWGKPTFDGLVADKDFAQENKEFMSKLVKITADLDAQYRSSKAGFDTSHPIAKSIAKVTGGDINTVADVLALYEFPDLSEQLSCSWLGCGAQGGAAKSLQATSEFLKSERKINDLMPDYSVFVNPEYATAASKL